MKHLIRIAFWIVTIAVFCLNTQGKPVTKRLIEMSDFLLKDVSCIEGSGFYAPVNIEKKCFLEAVNCVIRELKRADESEECSDPQNRTPQALEALDRVVDKLNSTHLTKHNCNMCEQWPEKNFNSFVDDMMTLLQKINAEHDM